jgi:hypothetical protein
MNRVEPHMRYFLGGVDLEMTEIRNLLEEVGLGARIVDHSLRWGALASAYEPEIRAALAAGETPVLIELSDDLPEDIDRGRLVVIDHHGVRAGVAKPSSLRQVFDLAGAPRDARWTRQRALVEANDVGHIPAMRALGASAEEIRAVRDADRAAQGVTDATEAESRLALAGAQKRGSLLIVRTTAANSSAIGDFVTPEYGGPGAENLVVVMPDKVAFFGSGAVVQALADVPGCWYGGALPEHGYWGANVENERANAAIARIHALILEQPRAS